jgi:hypothetical protein
MKTSTELLSKKRARDEDLCSASPTSFQDDIPDFDANNLEQQQQQVVFEIRSLCRFEED